MATNSFGTSPCDANVISFAERKRALRKRRARDRGTVVSRVLVSLCFGAAGTSLLLLATSLVSLSMSHGPWGIVAVGCAISALAWRRAGRWIRRSDETSSDPAASRTPA